MGQCSIRKKIIRVSLVIIVGILFVGLIRIQYRENLATNRFRKALNSDLSIDPQHLYILIDDSFTANKVDSGTEIRSDISKTILQFVTGYYWINDSLIYTKLYFYGSQYSDSKVLIWPQKGESNKLDIYNNSLVWSEIESVLKEFRENSKSNEDNFEIVLEEIAAQIDADGNKNNNSLVIVITEGNQEDSESYTCDNLQAAAEKWDSDIPFLIVLYSPSRNIQTLCDNWNENFFGNIKQKNSKSELFAITITDEKDDYKKIVWDWVANYYETKFVTVSNNVRSIIIDTNTNTNFSDNEIIHSTQIHFPCYPETARLFTRNLDFDTFQLTKSDMMQIDPVNKAAGMDNIFWEITDLQSEEINFNVRNSSFPNTILFYQYSCQPSTATLAPTFINTIAPTEDKDIEPPDINENKLYLIPSLLTLAIFSVAFLTTYFIGKLLYRKEKNIKKEKVYLFVVEVFVLLIILSGLYLLFTLSIKMFIDIAVSFFAEIVIVSIFSSGGIFVLIYRNKGKKEDNINIYDKYETSTILLPIFSTLLSVILLIIFLIKL